MNKTNTRVYHDEETNPENPGYVVAWDEVDTEGEVTARDLTAQLDATDADAAADEAAELIGVARSYIVIED